jgi:hypothetical protein
MEADAIDRSALLCSLGDGMERPTGEVADAIAEERLQALSISACQGNTEREPWCPHFHLCKAVNAAMPMRLQCWSCMSVTLDYLEAIPSMQ